MNNEKHFFSENLLMSVFGHLVLIALMVTAFHFAMNTEKLVAPDRVEITEIDLSSVEITRDKTEVYNTEIPAPEKIEIQKPDEKPEEVIPEKPIETPTLVESKTDATKEKPKEVIKKKTIVRVKRETASLNRTMTVSVVDALRVALTRCWMIDRTRDGLSDIRAVAHLTMNKNGMVSDMWFESAARADSDPVFDYVLETVRSAVATCQPFKMLPKSEFEYWEKIQLSFYPGDKSIR